MQPTAYYLYRLDGGDVGLIDMIVLACLLRCTHDVGLN